MNDEMSSKLDALFNARSKRQAEIDRVAREVKEVRQDNLQAFLDLKDSTIRPAFESFAGKLTEKGALTSLYEVEDGKWKGDGSSRQTIGIRFLVNGTQTVGFPNPYFAVSVDKITRRADFFSSAASKGSATPDFEGSCNFEEVTLELLNEMLFKVVSHAYK